MVGRDSVPPYERPPLSKEYLAGEKPFERLLIRPAPFWAERDVELMLETNVRSLDPAAKTLALSGGDTLSYGTLVWAAGGDPRRLSCPGALLPGITRCATRPTATTLPPRSPPARAARWWSAAAISAWRRRRC
jgi:3-phenylpropionate/trans-cinnamate dioxygenase ferredoxin reductase subunit